LSIHPHPPTDLVFDCLDSFGAPVGIDWPGHRDRGLGLIDRSSNVIHFLQEHGLPADPDVVGRLLAAAKTSPRVLTEAEVPDVLDRSEAPR
jgi:hypothetical protein